MFHVAPPVTAIDVNHATRLAFMKQFLIAFPVRATSVLCLLGLGLGISSLIVYRFCSRLFTSSAAKPKSASCKEPKRIVRGKAHRAKSSCLLSPPVTTVSAPPDSEQASPEVNNSSLRRPSGSFQESCLVKSRHISFFSANKMKTKTPFDVSCGPKIPVCLGVPYLHD